MLPKTANVRGLDLDREALEGLKTEIDKAWVTINTPEPDPRITYGSIVAVNNTQSFFHGLRGVVISAGASRALEYGGWSNSAHFHVVATTKSSGWHVGNVYDFTREQLDFVE